MSKSNREQVLDVKKFKTEKYKTINKDGSETNTIKPLGEGCSGIVYLSEQSFTESAKVKRAVKFFIFRDDLQKRLGTYISSDNFQDEIINITLFSHENLIKVIDGGGFMKQRVIRFHI